MNAKERVRLAVAHRETDRLPINFMSRQEILQALMRHFGVNQHEALLEHLRVDLRGVGPAPRYRASHFQYADPTLRVAHDSKTGQDVYFDIWGVGFARKQALGAEYLDLFESPLTHRGILDDLKDYPFPTAELWDYSMIADQARRNRDYYIGVHSRGFFEISWFMRGMNNFLTDLVINSEYAETLMDRILEYLMDRTIRVLEQDRERLIDFVEINDDVGGQNGLLLSPALWRAFIKPRMQRMIDRFKQYEVKIRYHCCGGLREIIPDLIDIGVDILNPVQARARGMELAALKRDFGAQITFDGGIDTQELLPHRRGPAFEEEVRRILRAMGKQGGYIVGPSHAFQVDVPLDNVLKLYEIAAQPFERI